MPEDLYIRDNQPQTDEELVGEVEEFYRSSSITKTPYEGNWFLNIAFYLGYQWTTYNVFTREIYEIENETGEIRITSNQIQPKCRRLISKFASSRPAFAIPPYSNEQQDISSAKASEKILEHILTEVLKNREKNLELFEWSVLTGTAFKHVYWDISKGKEIIQYQMQDIQDPETGETFPQPILDEQGDPQVASRFRLGEIGIDVCSPFEIYVDPNAKSMDDLIRILRARIIPVSRVEEIFDQTVNEEKDLTLSTFYQRRLASMVNPEFFGASRGTASMKDCCILKELWEKPTKQYPRGRYRAVASNKLLFNGTNPVVGIFPDDWWNPFVRYDGIPLPGRFWQIGFPEPARPLQVEYNKVRSEIVMNRITAGRNKIVIPKGAGIDENALTNIHGEIVEYNPGYKPDLLPALALPAQTMEELSINLRDMDNIFGDHEVTRGQTPPNVESGLAIRFLQEQDESIHGSIISTFETGEERLYKMVLSLAKAYYQEPRTIEVVGDNNRVEALSFSGNDIVMGVKVQVGSGIPSLRAAEQSFYLELFQNGALVKDDGTPDIKLLWQLLDITPKSVQMKEELDHNRALYENQLMAQGNFMPPMEYEDHVIHIDDHNTFRKSQAFYDSEDMTKQIFQVHVTMHEQILAYKTAQVMAQMMAPEMMMANQEKKGDEKKNASKEK